MESFLFADAGWVTQGKALENIISPMAARLSHLLVSMERKDVKDEVFASLEEAAEELAAASEGFVQAAKRLAEDSEEKWLREEMAPVVESLVVSGRNIVQVAQKLHLQPGSQCHREGLVAAIRQILVDTAQVLLLEDAVATGKAVRAAGRCLSCLEALEAAPDGASLRQALAALAAALLPLGHLGRPLRGCVPALMALARGHRGHPWDPQLAASRGRASALLRVGLGELLARRERPAMWPCRLQLCSARLPDLAVLRGPGETGQGRSGRVAPEALTLDVHSGLLRQVLDTFTDTHGPLQRLVQTALSIPAAGAPSEGQDSGESLRLSLAAFRDQAKQMVRVSRLALACCSGPQKGRDLEMAAADLWGLVLRVHRLCSQNPQGPGGDRSPAALQALLPAWAAACRRLLACFPDVLHIYEFLRVSVQEMVKDLDALVWAARPGDARVLARCVACLQGRATHIVQVMSRFLSQARDPIFRNGLRVLIWQLEQSSSLLGAAAQRSSSGSSSHDTDVVLTMARHLICSAEKVRDGLDGTNHPDILSPLRDQVPRFDAAKERPCVIVPSPRGSAAPELKFQCVPGLGESDPDASCPPTSHSYHRLIPNTHTQSRETPPLATSKLILAADTQSSQATCSYTSELEQEASAGAAQEALAGEGLPGSQRTTRLQEASTQPPPGTDPAREAACLTAARSARLLPVAPRLSGGTCGTKQRGLVAMVGDWYFLCQQLFCQVPRSDLPGSTAVFTELQQNLASMVQLAGQRGPTDLEEEDPGSLGLPEMLLQTQGRWEEVETHGRQLLDQVLASDGLQAPKSIETGCLLWSAAVQALVRDLGRLSRRQGLFLLPLRQAVRGQRGLQEGLAQAADVSQRLHEAARLSKPLCGDEQVKGEVSFLCREVCVLRDALLDVAQILGSSPSPSPSLSTRFELLCLEFALRAQALTGHLSRVNADYERAFQDAVGPGLSGGKNPQARTERSLQRMVSGIQAVLGIVARGQEPGSCHRDLLVALDRVLILTKEVAWRVPVLQQGPEEWGTHMLGWLRRQWAARAHHAAAQLQAWKGDQSEAWRLLDQCLRSKEGPAGALEQGPVQPQLYSEEAAAGAAAGGAVATPGSSVGTDTIKPAIAGATTAGTGTQQQDGPPGCPGPLAAPDRPARDGGADRESRIAQLPREMAREVFLMAQSLKRSGRVLTKDQLITSARKVAASSQDFSRLIGIIAKNCADQRCSQELSCVVERMQTLGSQLSILSSVQAAMARSKSSEELLVGSAQRLLRAVLQALSAAEAASLRGLSPPSEDLEEQEVAASCIQWRRKLRGRRLQEKSSAGCDALGLRATGTRRPLELTAARVQGAS